MIIDEINKSNIQAMKNKDQTARTILGILKNKIMLLEIEKKSKGQSISEADQVQIIQKTIKELLDEQENYEKVNNNIEVENIKKQKEIIEKFLPKMLSEEEIKLEILSLPDTTIPTVMKHFKTNFSGKCDMSLVQKILKTL